MEESGSEQKQGFEGEIDVEKLMERIRSEVKQGLADKPLRPAFFKNDNKRLQGSPTQSILYSEELNYLNANWNSWSLLPELTSHRRWLGRIIVSFKAFVRDILWNSLLKDYFDSERHFQMNLVKYLNANARYIDSRAAEIFWQLIKKIDNDAAGINERTDLLFNDLLSGSRAQISGLEQRLEVLERESRRITTGLELLLDDLDMRQRSISAPAMSGYTDLADTFHKTQGIVVDLACQGSEFLQALRNLGCQELAVCFDSEVHQGCVREGFSSVSVQDWRYLEQFENGALGGIMIERIEQWASPAELDSIVELLCKKIRPGGKVIFELSKSGSNWQIRPEDLERVLPVAGIVVQSVERYSGGAEAHRLRKVEAVDHLPARWKEIFETINANIERLNYRFFRSARVAVIGIVERRKEGSVDRLGK